MLWAPRRRQPGHSLGHPSIWAAHNQPEQPARPLSPPPLVRAARGPRVPLCVSRAWPGRGSAVQTGRPHLAESGSLPVARQTSLPVPHLCLQLTRRQATYAEFTALLPEAECRYGVYDFAYVGREGVEKSKLFFVSWVPDVAKIKAKMLYASSKEAFRRLLDGVQLEIQATDASEIEESVLREKCTSVGQ